MFKSFIISKILVALAVTLFFAGCKGTVDFGEDDNGGDDFESTELNRTAQNVLNVYCQGCHLNGSSPGATAWKDLRTNEDWQKVGLVVAGSPQTSALLSRVKFGPGGTRINMPMSADLFNSFTQEDYNTLADWIKNMPPADLTPPVASPGKSHLDLPFGTTSAELLVSTNERSECRFSNQASSAISGVYSTMTENLSPSSDGKSHIANVTGLTSNTAYNYYIRCVDGSKNESIQDLVISFRVLAQPVGNAPQLSNLMPSSNLPAGTTTTTLSLTTNKTAICRYSTTAGRTFAQMTNNFTASGNNHSASVSGLVNGQSYNYYVRCQDTASNANTTDAIISFQVMTPLTARQVMSNFCVSCHAPFETFTDADFQSQGLVVAGNPTNSALIRRLRHSGINTANMPSPVDGSLWNAFTLTNFQTISTWVQTMSPIQTDIVAAVRSGGSPVGALSPGTTTAQLRVLTNEAATCRYATAVGTAYANMTGTMSADTNKVTHTANLSGLTNGQTYYYYVRCIDLANNINTNDYAVTFSVSAVVDSLAPIVSNPQPSSALAVGTSVATLSVTTNEQAVCRYSSTANTSFDSMTKSMTPSTTGTTHQADETVMSGTTYRFYVRCRDTANNKNTADTRIDFSVNAATGNLLVSSTESIRISDRVFMKSFLDHLYGSSAEAMTNTMVFNESSKFDGPCDPMGAATLGCKGLDVEDISAPLLPVMSTPRAGQVMKVCNRLSFTDATVNYAISNITGQSNLSYLTTTPIPTDAELQKAYEFFYPGRNASLAIVTKLRELATVARESGKERDPWRYVLLTLCWSPDWQMP